MKTKKEISEFYDQYTEQQKKMWHNERHYFLIDQLKKAGIKNNSKVLEVGCGIGTMTNLIAPILKDGQLIATDISPKSIALAKENNKKFSNVQFYAADATDFKYPQIDYDFVVLFDVLEHIQEEFRAAFIKNISSSISSKTIFLINVPAPNAHVHAIKNTPELMQIVEEPVWLHKMSVLFMENGLEIRSFFTYDLWQKDEYQFYVVEKKKPYVFLKTTPDKKFNPQSLQRRIGRKVRSIGNG